MYLPERFKERLKGQLQEEYEDYLACMERGMVHGLRVNTNKISADEFLKLSPFALRPVPWTKNGFYYDETACTPSKHPYYYAGLYYLQEPSAMTPASVLPIDRGDIVLDICAAPGGKSTELGARLFGTGCLISNDISHSRAKALLKNLELFGIANLCVASEPPNHLSERFEQTFDKILVDAPCSGEGMFRKSRSMVTAWEKNGVELFAGLQKGILNEAAHMLAPGGILVYSTCTFSPEENERSIEYLLSLDAGLTLLDVPKQTGFSDGVSAWGETENPDLAKCARLWPHRIEGEGHFVAMLQKKDASEKKTRKLEYAVLKRWKPEPYAMEFLRHIDAQAGIRAEQIEENDGRLFWICDSMPDVSGLRLLRKGLFLGESKKNRFEPSQALAMYLKRGWYDNEVDFPASDERVTRYLKGETIEVDEPSLQNGYALVLVDGYPLGWAKNTNGTLKNKYLSGWRMMA